MHSSVDQLPYGTARNVTNGTSDARSWSFRNKAANSMSPVKNDRRNDKRHRSKTLIDRTKYGRRKSQLNARYVNTALSKSADFEISGVDTPTSAVLSPPVSANNHSRASVFNNVMSNQRIEDMETQNAKLAKAYHKLKREYDKIKDSQSQVEEAYRRKEQLYRVCFQAFCPHLFNFHKKK